MHSISLIVYRPPITEANSLPCAIAFRLSAKAASRPLIFTSVTTS